MSSGYQVSGHNSWAPFSLKLHRGEGMVLLAMNWRHGQPPMDFVGFAIEYQEPNGTRFYPLKNRLGFPTASGTVSSAQLSTRFSPIQKFRWIHFARNAELDGDFRYRVTPVFMNDQDELSYGEAQEAAIQLRRETYPGQLNVAFTRGFVSSQAFVDRYQSKGPISKLLPAKASLGLGFVPTHPLAQRSPDLDGLRGVERDPRGPRRRRRRPGRGGSRGRLRPQRAGRGRRGSSSSGRASRSSSTTARTTATRARPRPRPRPGSPPPLARTTCCASTC